jgi:hypothetical protein
MPGFTSIKTRRSASSASTISPASIKSGLTSSYFHTAVVAFGFGRGGTILAISVHKGATCFGGRDSRKAPSDMEVEVSKTVVIDIIAAYIYGFLDNTQLTNILFFYIECCDHKGLNT